MKKITYILLAFILLTILLSGCKVPQKSKEIQVENQTIFRYDTVTLKHTKRVPEIVKVPKYQDTLLCPKDTVIITKTVYKAKRIKIKDSYNVDNSEVIRLRNSLLVKDSQIDSLTAITGKGAVGEQTNNNQKWWVWLLIGIAIGGGGYQLVRTLITKKV
jgi:hypothetical protein